MELPHLSLRRLIFPAALACYWLPALALGAESELDTRAAAESAEWFWNLVIALFVIVISAASAALPVAATKQWTGNWRIAAIVPLALLLVWIAVIVIARMESSDAHRLWPFEIFAWAMLNMIYMVAVMTIKRILDKENTENPLSD